MPHRLFRSGGFVLAAILLAARSPRLLLPRRFLRAVKNWTPPRTPDATGPAGGLELSQPDAIGATR